MPKDGHTSVTLPTSLAKELATEAARVNRTRPSFVRQLLNDYQARTRRNKRA